MKTEKIVRFISGDNKYKRFPFPVIPAFDAAINNYVTGQEKRPENPDGLTKEEMTGEATLPKKKADTYPFVIDPNVPHNLMHMQSLNISTDSTGNYVNPRDKALFDLFILQKEVALNKEKYIKGKHIFYIDDEELQATENVKKKDLVYEAIAKVKTDTALNKFIELAMWLNYVVPDLNIAVSRISITKLQSAIYDACENHPKEVLSFYDSQSRDVMFVLKLHYYDIISRRNNAYWDGETLLGKTPVDVMVWARKKENDQFFKQWGEMLNKIEGKADIALSTHPKTKKVVDAQ